MPELIVYRDEQGKLQGHGEKGRRDDRWQGVGS